MTPFALTDIAILLWVGALFGFGVGRFFRLRATYKGRRQTAQSNVFPMDRIVVKKHYDEHGEIPF